MGQGLIVARHRAWRSIIEIHFYVLSFWQPALAFCGGSRYAARERWPARRSWAGEEVLKSHKMRPPCPSALEAAAASASPPSGWQPWSGSPLLRHPSSAPRRGRAILGRSRRSPAAAALRPTAPSQAAAARAASNRRERASFHLASLSRIQRRRALRSSILRSWEESWVYLGVTEKK